MRSGLKTMQLRTKSHFFATSWTHRFKLWAKHWMCNQSFDSFFIRAWTPFRTPLIFDAPSYAWPTQLVTDSEHHNSASLRTLNCVRALVSGSWTKSSPASLIVYLESTRQTVMHICSLCNMSEASSAITARCFAALCLQVVPSRSFDHIL